MDFDSKSPNALLNTASVYGEIKLSIHYMKDSQQLKVVLLKAVNLGQTDLRCPISSYVKLCLSPGKMQKQSSAVVKQNRCPVFNEEFYFNDVDLETLQHLNLQVKVLNKGLGMRRKEEFLGQVSIALGKLPLITETRMWTTLLPKPDSQVRY